MTYSYKPKKFNSSQTSGNQESSIVFVLEKGGEEKEKTDFCKEAEANTLVSYRYFSEVQVSIKYLETT